jgi:L-asparaginase II
MIINPVLAEVVRSRFVESRHRGAVAGLAADGTIAVRAGDIETPIFPRSSNKPLQAVGMLRCGRWTRRRLIGSSLPVGARPGS